jgi:hypothetical protein
MGTEARHLRLFQDHNRTGRQPMPIILWLLGVPLGLVLVLMLVGVV